MYKYFLQVMKRTYLRWWKRIKMLVGTEVPVQFNLAGALGDTLFIRRQLIPKWSEANRNAVPWKAIGFIVSVCEKNCKRRKKSYIYFVPEIFLKYRFISVLLTNTKIGLIWFYTWYNFIYNTINCRFRVQKLIISQNKQKASSVFFFSTKYGTRLYGHDERMNEK